MARKKKEKVEVEAEIVELEKIGIKEDKSALQYASNRLQQKFCISI